MDGSGAQRSRTEARERFGGAEFAFEVALDGLEGEAAQILGAAAGPGFGGKGGDRGMQDALGQLPGIGAELAGADRAMNGAEEAVAVDAEPNFRAVQGLATGRAVEQVGEQAHEAGHPELEVGERHPELLRGGLVEDGGEEAKDGLLGVVVGEGLIEQLGVKAEDGEADRIDRRGERRAEDFKLVEADQFLTGPLGKPGAGLGHGLERSAETLAAFERGLGHAADPAVVAGEETDDQVGLVDRPGAQNHGLGGEYAHALLSSHHLPPAVGPATRSSLDRAGSSALHSDEIPYLQVRNFSESKVKWKLKGIPMPTAKMTSKGQITIPIQVRKALRLKPGVQIDFYAGEDGAYALRAKTGSIMELEGCIAKPDHTITIEEMNRAILDHAAQLDAATRSDAGENLSDGEAA
jgi:antitoxin PrlF